MSSGWQAGWECMAIAAVALSAHGQAARMTSAGGTDTVPRALLAPSAYAAQTDPVYGEAVREIDDPHTGDRWLLLRDASHPGGPGRLVLLGSRGNVARQDRQGDEHLTPEIAAVRVMPMPVIHAGERLIVEEDTAVVSSRLEAVALGPAAVGAAFEVRLKIGGKLLLAVALAPGRAAFQAEARP
jgi:hypothetical protein